MTKTSFKGWSIPGPVPPGIEAAQHVVEKGETLDALSGHFKIFQLRDGHRFSTDDLLVAWYGTTHASRVDRALDLGSGIGSVGMTAAWRLPGAHFTTIEAQSESVRLARKSAKLNGLEDRFDIREGDFRDEKVLGENERFDLILGSPPYFPLDAGIQSEHPQKVACRFEVRGTIADYCAVASRHLAPGGAFAFVFPIEPDQQMTRVERAVRDAGLSLIRQRPIILREEDAPLLSVFLASLASDLPESIRNQSWREPPLKIRAKDGSVHPEYRAVKLSIGFPP